MIRVDLLRALITLTPVVYYYLGQKSLLILAISSFAVASLGAFFEPALQSTLPHLCEDKATLKATNGLMSTTLRLARVMGPALIGVLSAFFTTIHFFTINALTFVLSALSIFSIRNKFSQHTPNQANSEPILKNISNSFLLIKREPAVYHTFMAKTISGGAWWLTYGLGMALLIHEISPDNVKAFGLVMSAYGVGNVIGALWIGNLERKHSERMVYIGLTWLGVCFAGIALSQNFYLLIFFTALAAIGGPLNDLPFVDLVQNSYNSKELQKIFRLRISFEPLVTLVFLLASPFLFKYFQIRTVILGCGIFILIIGSIGITKVIRFSRLSTQ